MFSCRINEDLELKLLEPRYASELFALIDRNRGYLREWLPWVDRTRSEADLLPFIEGTLKQFAGNNGFNCGIFYKNRIAGVIGFHGIDWSNKKTTIGYWLGESYQGNGIMTAACRRLVDYAIRELGLNRVVIQAGVENTKSRAIPERLGFRQEGVLKQTEWVNDRYVDHAVYAMLADEWETASSG